MTALAVGVDNTEEKMRTLALEVTRLESVECDAGVIVLVVVLKPPSVVALSFDKLGVVLSVLPVVALNPV